MCDRDQRRPGQPISLPSCSAHASGVTGSADGKIAHLGVIKVKDWTQREQAEDRQPSFELA